MSMNHWVMDYETLANCFVAVFEHYKEDRRFVFTIHKKLNHLKELIAFLEGNRANKEWHVSFNGLGFDSQITEFIIREKETLLLLPAEEVARRIYSKAQNVILRQEENQWPEWSEKDLSIKQIDVFKLNHWDNPAKRSSLKWIQYSMDWLNIQEMPIHHSTEIETLKEINLVIDYCCNDVKSTKRIMHLSKDQIALRAALTKEYKINLYSASEPRISKELFLHFLSKQIDINKYELKQMRTKRSVISMNELILPYTSFKTEPFQDILNNFRKVKIDAENTKGGFKYSMYYKDVKTDFGLGGVHGAAKKGIYEAKDGMIIMTSDVTSFYPNLAIRNKWSPAHLPKEAFCQLYEWFFEERKKIPKKDIRNYVYKIILNSTYGLSNDKNSFLYDPEFTMRITINGQLSLMMLYEMLSEGIPGSVPLMQNTDGLEMMIPETYKERYLEICAEWEKITNLQLEHDQYSKLILADVNNYIAVAKEKQLKSEEEYEKIIKDFPYCPHRKDESGFYYSPVKCKGRFEFDNLALHKNKSCLIIPKALLNYFVHGMLPEKTILDNKNILDYCSGVKIKGDWKFVQFCARNGELTKEDLQKTIRYYISRSGCKIVKTNLSDKREIQVESGKWLLTTLNTWDPKKVFETYDVDINYYTDRIYKEINNIIRESTDTQYSLFNYA